jgi:DNA-binding transcriptional regulator YiaG
MVTAKQLKKVRTALDESQAEFAKRFGVNQSTLHRWEHKMPKKGSAQRVAEYVLAELSVERARATE